MLLAGESEGEMGPKLKDIELCFSSGKEMPSSADDAAPDEENRDREIGSC